MIERRENILATKIEDLTNRLVKLVIYLKQKGANANYINQIDRCGTSIGANFSEAIYAQSRADYRSKLKISLKETNETSFWLRKLHTAQSLDDREFASIYKDVREVVYIMVATLKTMDKNDKLLAENVEHSNEKLPFPNA